MWIRIVWGILLPFIAIILGLVYLGLERKITARVQRRYGPPFYQNIIDVLKLFFKGNLISHGVMFDLGPVIAVTGVILSLYFIPIGNIPLFSFSGDIIVILYLMVIAPLGMALGAGESGNPNAAIGVARALTLMLAYEAVFVISMIAVMIFDGTASFMKIIEAQSGGFTHWHLWPLFLSALAMDIALQGMLGEKPFDQPVAPHEIASGPMVEYGGKFLGMLQVYHAVGVILETALFVDLFMGGGNVITFFAKSFIMYVIALLISSVMPRFRIGQAFTFYWTYPAILGVLGLIVTII